MKTLLLFLLLVVPLAAEVDLNRELRAIEAVETGNRWQIGHAGETGPAQMTLAARMTVRGDPINYLRWLAEIIPNPTPYRLALAYHAGPTGMLHPNAKQRDYAQRCANLYVSGY
jgi:hypothetical protein